MTDSAPEKRPGKTGHALIQDYLKTLDSSPGVYRMLDAQGAVLYVGKARSLRARVSNYARGTGHSARIARMIRETASMMFLTTRTETEALLLEQNLIKQLKPRYNVLLRDDKSFPNILVAKSHPFAQIKKHRGAKAEKGDYYGPFASAGAVNRTLNQLQRVFLLRSCTDATFSSRTRPCLLYQIKRCSAPCVGRISEADYAKLVAEARDFLSGKSQAVQAELAEAMQDASERLDFEQAARYRDRIRALAHVQSHQDVNVAGVEDADVIAARQMGGQTCIQVFFFRAGRNYGNRSYFPSHDKSLDQSEVLGAFVAQFYENKPIPKLVLLNAELDEQALVADALALSAGRQVEIAVPKRGAKRKLVEAAERNAEEALARRLADSSAQSKRLQELADLFDLEQPPERIEVYDNSHIQGSNPYGAMIVAGPEGFRKNAYRRFAIRGLSREEGEESASNDDYAMMREVLTRRFSRAQKEDPERTQGGWPDLVLVDGGRGQLNAALDVFAELGIEDLPVAGIAKGPERDAGRERIFLADRAPILLQPADPLLHYIQRLRDEAHRFAIGTHRAGRSKARLKSVLDDIPGIGPTRKKALLHHFGSARAVEQAGLADLEAVEGISSGVAKKIHDFFHGG